MNKMVVVAHKNVTELNKLLEDGMWEIESVTTASQVVSSYGYGGGETFANAMGEHRGNVYAYVVLKKKHD